MVRAKECYARMRAALRKAGITQTIEAHELFCAAVGCRVFDAPDFISDESSQRLNELVLLRINGRPLQYIVGEWTFLDFELKVGEGVLIPRTDTESVAQKAISLLPDGHCRAIDLCSGSGCIAIALKRAVPALDVTAVELSDEALKYLAINVGRLAGDVKIVKADALDYYEELLPKSIDLIVSNPPYVTESEYDSLEKELYAEPKMALVSGKTGYEFYEKIAESYHNALKPGGSIVFEVGDGMAERVMQILGDCGYHETVSGKDTFGNIRYVSATRV